MNREVETQMRFHSRGRYSMPLQRGDKACTRGRPDVFTALAFGGHVYRLHEESGAELKASVTAVERKPEKAGR